MRQRPRTAAGSCTSWNGGASDGWLPAQVPFSPLQDNVPVTMGFYTRRDLPRHHLLADVHGLRRLFCSLLGRTHAQPAALLDERLDRPRRHDGGPGD